MFIDTELRPQGEVQQQVGRIKLSEAIRKGRESVSEDRSFYGCSVCAACWVTGLEVVPGNFFAIGGAGAMFSHLEKATGAPREIIAKVSDLHYQNTPESQLIDWLESQGL